MRLEKARAALLRLEEAKSLDEAESAWLDILLAGNGIYSKLQHGSEISSKAKAWFGGVKHLRRTDPLLSYMHHARNSDEHGLEDVANKISAGSATITFTEESPNLIREKGLKIFVNVDANGKINIISSNKDAAFATMYNSDALILNTVNDKRFGDSFAPPSSHLGEQLSETSPVFVGRLYLTYLDNLISQARASGV